MTHLYFDIETIPAPDERLPFLKRLHVEKLAKDKELGTTATSPDFDIFYRKTALNAAYGRVFCISMIKEKDGMEIGKTTLCEDEKEILRKFWGICRDVNCFVGHGIRFFDIKFLMQRSIILGIPHTAIPLKKFSDYPVYDIMDQWMSYDGTISLHELAHALSIPSPKEGGIDGSQVYDFFLANKHQEICDYCMRDVETVKSVHQVLRKYRQ